MVRALVRIETSLARIDAAPVWRASVDALRFTAQSGTVHYSTLIEGNRLSALEAARATRGELDATTRDEIELVNYVDAMRAIDERIEAGGSVIDEQFVLAVHREATKGLDRPGTMFEAHHVGAWRDGIALVVDPITQRVMHEAPGPTEVEERMVGLVSWVANARERETEWPVPVVAALLHYHLTDIHPFADGNGRVARLMSYALMASGGYMPGRMFNLDAHYGTDREAYLEALRSVRRLTFSQNAWVTYFLEGAAEEYERVAREIAQFAGIGTPRLQLKSGQQQAVTSLLAKGRTEFSRSEYQTEADVSRATAGRDVAKLVAYGIVVPVQNRGGGSERFRFASAEAPANPLREDVSVGRPREWTDERIERELRALIGDSGRYPTVKQFDEAGLRPLYTAIGREGGSQVWARRVGVAPPRRGGRR